MNRLEDRVREALDDQASARQVDTHALWRATEPRLRKQRRVRPVLIGLAAASVAVAAAYGIGALTSNDQTFTPAATPTPSIPPPPGDILPSPNPSLEMWPDASGRLTTKEAQDVFKAAQRIDDLGDGHFVPIDVVKGNDGSRWALGAYRVEADAPRNPSGKPMLCYRTLWLSGPENAGEGAGCGGTKLPEPEDTGNATLTSTHSLNLPVDGDGDHLETGYEFYAGQAATTVDRVVGIDAKGEKHEGVVAGWTMGWELRQYFIVTKTEVTLTKVEAYDKDGRLLTTVPVGS